MNIGTGTPGLLSADNEAGNQYVASISEHCCLPSSASAFGFWIAASTRDGRLAIAPGKELISAINRRKSSASNGASPTARLQAHGATSLSIAALGRGCSEPRFPPSFPQSCGTLRNGPERRSEYSAVTLVGGRNSHGFDQASVPGPRGYKPDDDHCSQR